MTISSKLAQKANEALQGPLHAHLARPFVRLDTTVAVDTFPTEQRPAACATAGRTVFKEVFRVRPALFGASALPEPRAAR